VQVGSFQVVLVFQPHDLINVFDTKLVGAIKCADQDIRDFFLSARQRDIFIAGLVEFAASVCFPELGYFTM